MRLRLDLQLRIHERLLLNAQVDSTANSWALVGPSGSGKSTLLRILAGVEDRATGLLEVDGECWQTGSVQRVPPWRRRVGWVPQEALLFPHLSVRQNLLFGHRGTESGPQVSELAERLHISELLDRQPRHLSGGEKQRVALGRALLSAPRLLLLDEPFSSLDRHLRSETIDTVRSTCRQWNIPVIVVSHDPRDLEQLTDVWLEVSEGLLERRDAA